MEDVILKVNSEDEAVIKLKELYRRYGYLQYRMSKFEEYDLYVENKNFLVSGDIITFNDFNGKLMALKPDVTLSILKKVQASQETEKLFYNENVYRAMKNTREVREVLQVGLECIGDVGVYETGEVLSLAAKSLEILTEHYVIDISHMGFLNGLLQETNLTLAQKTELMGLVKDKNSHDILRICRKNGVEETLAQRIQRAAALWGSFEEVVPELRELSINAETERAIQELIAVYAILQINGTAGKVKIDFSVLNDLHYYNAIVFQGFIEGIPTNVLSGGRYDKLLEKFQKKSGAIGFAVYLGVLWQSAAPSRAASVDIGVYYTADADLQVLAKAVRDWTEAGKSVSVQKADGDSERKCRKKYRISGGRLEEL